jgi:hypothetical protein
MSDLSFFVLYRTFLLRPHSEVSRDVCGIVEMRIDGSSGEFTSLLTLPLTHSLHLSRPLVEGDRKISELGRIELRTRSVLLLSSLTNYCPIKIKQGMSS